MQEQQQAMHAGLKEIWAALQKALTQKQKQQLRKTVRVAEGDAEAAAVSSSSGSPYVAEQEATEVSQ